MNHVERIFKKKKKKTERIVRLIMKLVRFQVRLDRIARVTEFYHCMERCTCNLHPFSSNDTKKAMKLHAFVADNAEGRLTMRERLSLAEFAFRSCFERVRNCNVCNTFVGKLPCLKEK